MDGVRDWCDTPLKPDDADVLKAMKDDKAPKQLVEAIAVMSVLKDATCKMPAYLQIDLKLSELTSHDKYFDLFVNTAKAFAEKFYENTNGNGMAVVLTTDEKPQKRTRRATNGVITFFCCYFPIINIKCYLLYYDTGAQFNT